jgi:hypothetical protein
MVRGVALAVRGLKALRWLELAPRSDPHHTRALVHTE